MKRLAAAMLLVGCVTPALADIAWVRAATVQRTLIQENVFGNCMILVNKPIADAGLSCPSRWISFSCDGTFSSKANAQNMLDSAQMAFALNKKVHLKIDDSKKHNGYCVAIRFDVSN